MNLLRRIYLARRFTVGKNLFSCTHVELFVFVCKKSAHVRPHKYFSHDAPRDRWTIGKMIYISLTFYCFRVRCPTKRHSKDINRDKKKWQYFQHYLLACAERSNNCNFRRFAIKYLLLLRLLLVRYGKQWQATYYFRE